MACNTTQNCNKKNRRSYPVRRTINNREDWVWNIVHTGCCYNTARDTSHDTQSLKPKVKVEGMCGVREAFSVASEN